MSTVVITGGSRGIGAAAVEAFAARGDKVYFLYEKNHEEENKGNQEVNGKFSQQIGEKNLVHSHLVAKNSKFY